MNILDTNWYLVAVLITVLIALIADRKRVMDQNKDLRKSMLLAAGNFSTSYGKALKIMLDNETPVDLIIADIQNRSYKEVEATFGGFIANELLRIKI